MIKKPYFFKTTNKTEKTYKQSVWWETLGAWYGQYLPTEHLLSARHCAGIFGWCQQGSHPQEDTQFCSFHPALNAACCCSAPKSCPTLWPHGLQHARLLCISLFPRVCSDSCPLSQWCSLTISSSAVPFSFCLLSFPASGSFPNESALLLNWPKYWSFSYNNRLSIQYLRLISLRIDWVFWILLIIWLHGGRRA